MHYMEIFFSAIKVKIFHRKKANSTLGFLRPDLKCRPMECKTLAYIALVRSTLEYIAIVWDSYQQQDIQSLKKIQRLAERFIKNNYISLKIRRVRKGDASGPEVTTTTIMQTGIKRVQVGKDQEKAQPEKDSHSKNQGGKKPN